MLPVRNIRARRSSQPSRANDGRARRRARGGELTPHSDLTGLTISSLLINDCSVVRFIPRRAAAPCGPAINQFVSSRTPRMDARTSSGSAAVSFLRVTSDPVCSSSAIGMSSVGPGERIIARSIRLASSRTLPGHAHRCMASSSSFGITSMRRFIRRANRSTDPRNIARAPGCPRGARAGWQVDREDVRQ